MKWHIPVHFKKGRVQLEPLSSGHPQKKRCPDFRVPKSGILEKGVQFVSVLSRGVPLNHDNGSLTSLSLVFPSPCSQAPPNRGRETVWTRRRVWFQAPSLPPPTLPLCFAALNAVSQYHTATVNTHTQTQNSQTQETKGARDSVLVLLWLQVVPSRAHLLWG